MISLKNITYRIGSKFLIDNISADFHPGKLNLIIGPNGAGKSTLIKLISGQLKPKSGTIEYEGKALHKISLPELARKRAVLSQNIDLSFPLTVSEVVMMGRYPHFNMNPAERDREVCKQAMDHFNVTGFAERNYLTLSGGEQQRVHFARVFAQILTNDKNGMRYLFLDEPLTFLDVQYQFQFMQKIKELLKEENLIIIGVVHDLNLAAKFSDHILLLNNSKLLANGSPENVLSKENIRTVYQLEPVIHKTGDSFFMYFQ